MKVVHVGNVLLPPEHPDFQRIETHPGRWVLNLALAQKVHTTIEPDLVMEVPGASRDFSTNMDGIPVHFLAAPARFRATTFFIRDVQLLSRKILELKPDIVHAHGTEDAYGLVAQKTRLPYVITAQGLHFIINRRLKPKLISRERAVEFTEWFCLKYARHVIAKSDYVAQELARQFPHLVLHCIPNTFDPRLLEIHAGKEPHTIAFVGRIEPRKGVHLIREALVRVQREIPDVQLWIFGDRTGDGGEYETHEKALLAKLLGSRLKLHGTIPSLEVASQVAKATALVAPSLEEMFGNQLIEALLVGTHAIVSDETAMAENVRRFGNGTVVPQNNSVILADAIMTALRRASSYQATDAEAARAKIVDALGPAIVGRRHYDLYTEILASREV